MFSFIQFCVSANNVRARAEKMRSEAQRLKQNPPKLHYEKPSGVMVGPYGIIALPANILHALVDNGLLTVKQAQSVIDASRSQK